MQALEDVAAADQHRAAILADPVRRRALPATVLALAQATEAQNAPEAALHWYRQALERCWDIDLADDDPLVVAIVAALARLERI